MARGNRSDARRERTEEERERARQERARRRAGGEEGDWPAGPELEGPDAAIEPIDPPPEPSPAPPEPLPAPPEPPPAVAAAQEALEPAHEELEPLEPAHGELDPPHGGSERPREEIEPPTREVEVHSVESAEQPAAPPEEGSARRRRALPARRGSPLPPLPPGPGERPPAVPRRSGRRRVFARVGAVLALAAVAVALWLLVRPLIHTKHKAVIAAPVSVKVLVPEGETRLQIAQIAKADGLRGSYRAASRRSSLLDPTRYGAPAGIPDLEGFLFPDTFDIDRGAPVSQLVEAQLTDFRSRFGKSQLDAARALHITPYALLTVASMVEREAQIPKDRPLIAAVIYNRLNDGMPLGIDATIYYAYELKTDTPTYTGELTEAQLHIDSPYNTRLHTGLPPTPISNPGLASIEAAAHPAHVPYLYYVAGADGCGEQVFSTTEAQFDVDAAAYHEAVARNKGHPPVCRKK